MSAAASSAPSERTACAAVAGTTAEGSPSAAAAALELSGRLIAPSRISASRRSSTLAEESRALSARISLWSGVSSVWAGSGGGGVFGGGGGGGGNGGKKGGEKKG